MSDRIDNKTLDTSRPFLASDARRLGLPKKLYSGSRLRRLFHGVRIADDVEVTPLVLAAGALLLHPEGAFVSHRTAAAIHGVPVPTHPDVDVSVIRACDRRFTVGIKPHLAHHDEDVIRVGGVPVSSVTRMFAELARVLGLLDLVVVGDRLLKLGLCTAKDLVAYCKSWTGYCQRKAAHAASFVRAGVDSPMETRLRLLIVLAGLPEPVVNFKLRRRDGSVRRRLDLSYPTIRLIIEYDGRQHATDPAQWKSDIERREEFDGEKWRLVIVTRNGIYDDPLGTLIRVRDRLIELHFPGVPQHFSDEWLVHFMPR